MIYELMEFIKNAHTTYQATSLAGEMLKKEGFIELTFLEKWNIEKGKKYYIIKNDCSIIAFTIGTELYNPSLQMVASHNDSPMLKIKPKGVIATPNFTKINSEIYGGPIYSTFLDRKLGISGRIVQEENDELISKNITLDKTFIIPNLAIHMNRKINSGYEFNAQKDMMAIFSLGDDSLDEYLEMKYGKVLDYDLFLYNKEEPTRIGIHEDMIAGPRLDDLECYFASLKAFIQAKNEKTINMWIGFNNEEVGSRSNNAAGSTFLTDVINEILKSLDLEDKKMQIYQNSFLISADNAHALHPNHPELSDPTNAVYMNKGVVIKYSARQSYTTDAVSASLFKKLCNDKGIPYQEYTNRSDILGGGTLGNILLGTLSVTCLDIGLPQLAMHSSFETAGVKDFIDLIYILTSFYSKHITFRTQKSIRAH